MEGSGEHVPLASLDDIVLDLICGAAIVVLVSKSTSEWADSPTHFVNCSIALRMGEPGLYAPPPFVPRSRDWQISAQASPSSTKLASSITESCVRRRTTNKHEWGGN